MNQPTGIQQFQMKINQDLILFPVQISVNHCHEIIFKCIFPCYTLTFEFQIYIIQQVYHNFSLEFFFSINTLSSQSLFQVLYRNQNEFMFFIYCGVPLTLTHVKDQIWEKKKTCSIDICSVLMLPPILQ